MTRLEKEDGLKYCIYVAVPGTHTHTHKNDTDTSSDAMNLQWPDPKYESMWLQNWILWRGYVT